MNVRLYADQVERLRAGDAPGAAVIRYAVRRWRRGDFGVVCLSEKPKSNENTPRLESYPVWQRFGVCDALLREILRLHWTMPDVIQQKRIARELKQVEAAISEGFAAIGDIEYIEVKE